MADTKHEMGKILSEAEGEVEKCAWEADWYAEHGPQMFADAPAPTGKVEASVVITFASCALFFRNVAASFESSSAR